MLRAKWASVKLCDNHVAPTWTASWMKRYSHRCSFCSKEREEREREEKKGPSLGSVSGPVKLECASTRSLVRQTFYIDCRLNNACSP